MNNMEPVRVTGNCDDSIEEDLCAQLNHRVKKVSIHKEQGMIHVELLDCQGADKAKLSKWLNIEIYYHGRVYVFERFAIGTVPFVANAFGFNVSEPEASHAIIFTSKHRLN